MNRIIPALVFIVTLSLCSLAQTQAGRHLTVKDYFLLLPDEYMVIPKDRREQIIQNELGTIDVKNGFLSCNDSAESEVIVAVFKKPDGSHLIAVTYDGEGFDEQKQDIVSIFTLNFLRYESGRWKDVTKDTLPLAFDSRLLYKLPRYGTTIAVTNREGRKQYDLVWSGGKFTVKQAGRN